MKPVISVFILLFVTSSIIAQTSFQRNILFNDNWIFYQGSQIGAEKPNFNDSAWRKLDLPHDWSIEDLPGKDSPFDRNAVGQQSTGFTVGGTGWYRKHFEVSEKYKGQRMMIRFDGIYSNAEIWVNGQSVGKQPYGYSTFEFDISDKVKFGEPNLIAVKVMNEGENTRWYTGSGIYRHVWLDIVDPVRIDQWRTFITTPDVHPEQAKVNIHTKLVNDLDKDVSVKLTTIIKNTAGVEVGRTESNQQIKENEKVEINTNILITSPELWSVENPALYSAISEVYLNNQLADSLENKFGIRTISFDAVNGFQLNGKTMKLKGGCVHHDNGPLGAKAYNRAEERRVGLLKASGYNAIRCAHNPPSPAFLDACDRLGMLVINEAFDMWETGKNPFDYHLFFNNWWKKDMESMVLRDRNHPSIIMWSIGNEIPDMNKPEVVNTAKMLADHVRSLDSTRPVTAGVNQVKEDKDPFIANLDVAGYNYAFERYKSDHERDPKRVTAATESSPFLAFDYWMGVIDNPWVIGDFVWTSFDYIGEASIGWRGFWPDEHLFPWTLAYCGDIDICGWKRPQSFYRDVLWQPNQLSLFVKAPEPTFELNQNKEEWSQWHWHDVLADWNWKDYEDKPLEVNVYSSCEQVELFLNGKSLGKKPTNRENQFIAVWNVPYQAGVLKAAGYVGEKQVNAAELITSENQESIRLTADRSIINADGHDISYVTVEIVDKNGIKHPKAENLVTFEIEGPGEIIAVGNANPLSLESFQQPQRKAWQGKCLVIIKSGKQKGNVSLTAKSADLKPATLKIEVK
ncbi:MAG TPA: glycoside hydrolase family 2 TIM barrel-domain containing protein [Draconibacterium sp.]|nr:glycoside hydrolase family 2 TIM barrel-domain containing protein [Draconibacterium sp.]